MISSTDLDKLAEALAAAQAELENASKSSTNPHYKTKYADLTACIDSVRPCFAKHGLSFVQGVESGAEGTISVATRLLHKSGQWLESTLVIPLGKRDAQGVGAAATYGRRYALAAMCGLGQEDDDGNTASGIAKTRARTESTPTTLAELRKRFDAAQTPEDIELLARVFTDLAPKDQKILMPVAQAARQRCGL